MTRWLLLFSVTCYCFSFVRFVASVNAAVCGCLLLPVLCISQRFYLDMFLPHHNSCFPAA